MLVLCSIMEITKFLNSNIGRLRVVTLLEGVSFILLVFVAMPLKYLADLPMMVKVVGGIHGLLFVAFLLLILIVLIEKRITFMNSVWLFISSLIPFGTFVADHKILKPKHH